MRKFLRKKANGDNEAREKRDELMAELKEAGEAIDAVYTNLSYVVDPDMIDCCIYELNALQLRYKIILNQVKEQDARACMALNNLQKSADI